jgi:hypothetical protein
MQLSGFPCRVDATHCSLIFVPSLLLVNKLQQMFSGNESYRKIGKQLPVYLPNPILLR